MLPPFFLFSFSSLREKTEKEKQKKLRFDRKHSQKNKMETGRLVWRRAGGGGRS